MAISAPIPLMEPSPSPLPPPIEADVYLKGADHKDKIPIVIDNGTSELRAGFASSVRSSPSSSSSSGYAYSAPPPLHFSPIVSKYKDRKRALDVVLVGPSAYTSTESKSKARGATESGLIVAQDVLENVLDFTFSRLGISSQNGAVEHPVVMTEALCNPGFCRGLTSELLFEAYGVPSVSYGVDSLFAAYANDVGPESLVVSSGEQHTTVIPMVGGRGILGNAKRMNWGGDPAGHHLLRLLQLKYPAFPVRLPMSQAKALIETQGLFYTHPGGDSGDYASHIARLSDLQRLQAEGKTIQIPFVMPENNKRAITEEEKQRRDEKKKESARRLVEITQRNRLQKMKQKEEQLAGIAELKDWKSKERKAEWIKRVTSAGYEDEADLDREEKKIKSALQRSRKHAAPEDGTEEAVEAEVPTFPLVEIPDHELDEQSIQEKRRQRLLKAGYDARMRQKAEKLEEKRAEEEKRRLDEEERTSDLIGWAQSRRNEYEDVIERMKERKRKRELLSDRKSLAAQQRMKNIASLASEGPSDQASGSRGKRKRASGKDKGDDDNFGADDADWAIYRDIQGAEDSEDEEEDEALLADLESKLLHHDPTFSPSQTLAARQARKRALTRTFLGGTPDGSLEGVGVSLDKQQLAAAGNNNNSAQDDDDEDEETKYQNLARAHQITLNIERARVAEVFHQPSIAGVDQAGLDEVAEMVVRSFDAETRSKLVGNIFVTGRHTQYANFDERLKNAMISNQPVENRVRVTRAKDVRFDAWKGMARYCLERPDDLRAGSITRQMYEEYGSEYIKDHAFASALI